MRRCDQETAGWAAWARDELRAAGGDPPVPVEAVAGLTPRELQVAVAVAGGATTREAAAALFISPRTVEAHLGRVYAKLGVRSRAALADRLARRPAT